MLDIAAKNNYYYPIFFKYYLFAKSAWKIWIEVNLGHTILITPMTNVGLIAMFKKGKIERMWLGFGVESPLKTPADAHFLRQNDRMHFLCAAALLPSRWCRTYTPGTNYRKNCGLRQ